MSYKETIGNEASKGLAELKLLKNEYKTITLVSNTHTDAYNNIVKANTTEEWKNYKIELKEIHYDEYVDIIVSKK